MLRCTTIVAAALALAARSDAVRPLRRTGWIGRPPRGVSGVRNGRADLHRSAWLLRLCGGHTGGDDGRGDETDPSRRRLVLIVDVDNTLYSERDLVSSTGDGIESQIVRNTHLFGLLHFNMTTEECDALYREYGSTVEGLRHTLRPEQVEETMERFYAEVYDPIDFACLLGTESARCEDGEVRSGYDHGHELKKRRELAEFLKSICKSHAVYLASNSPRAHVVRVVNAMGLAGAEFAGVLALDMDRGDSSSGWERDYVVYPTKSSPRQYYRRLLDRYPPMSHRIVLLDDSRHNLREAASVGLEGILVGAEGRTLEEGLAEAMGHIPPPVEFVFSDVEYLRAKNRVDANAIDPAVWEEVAGQLAERLRRSKSDMLRVADLGAGVLSMLRMVMEGGGEGDREKPSMLSLVRGFLEEAGRSTTVTSRSIAKLEYFAYESNQNLLDGSKETLRGMGFEEIDDDKAGSGVVLRRILSHDSSQDVEVTVHLRPTEFQRERSPPEGLDLIIGCCFADLFDPDELVPSLHRFVSGQQPPLVYFPITFGGTTQFDRSHPQGGGTLPSDTTAFRIYSESLASHGHNLDPSRIVSAMVDHGGSLLSEGSSNWIIDPTSDRYLWQTMLYFFGMSGAREMAKRHFDSAGWIERCRRDPRTIIVGNVDLLFQLQADSIDGIDDDAELAARADSMVSVREIQFVAPYNVTTISKRWDTTDKSHLAPHQVEIESLRSLISSGTELKVFKGSFESASLDVNIKGMSDKAMEYPLAYGYSLVGRIVACGSDVDESLIGRLAFTFSPHSSRVIADRDAFQLVPDGIDAEDAIFLPSVETALSLVHDAHIRIGEKVAVFGQGIIGLLVTSILSMQSPLSVTAFDALNDRLGISGSLGATSAVKPNAAQLAGPFDVSIEVSGNPRALQSAIDHTSNHGRVIIGSWYGDKDIALKLGLDFHRSHKTIQTSQVSTIPPALAGLWDKERRFNLAWELLKALRPSRLITKRMPLDKAQEAYELLDKGREVAICFKYNE